ncbi:MAG: SCP2 sterol-binding domain-containing protein [Holophagales bacterium]|nr:SCP2 sterol-binding domain-containing protein [Holophagales bacterium]
MSDLFSAAWAAELERELTRSEEYRRAAASWRGTLAFLLEPTPDLGYVDGRSLFLDLLHGSPRAVRPALPGDLKAASFHLSGSARVWHDLLEGRLEAATALTGGRLRLVRGSLFQLLPHLGAARALLDCARSVGASPPEERA